MKSPMVSSATYISDEDKARYSDLKVMQSRAGFYIGTEYDNSLGFIEPGSRDTGYFRNRFDAEACLSAVLKGEYKTRMQP